MMYDEITYNIANGKAAALNSQLSEEQTTFLVHIPAVEATFKKPFYRADACCVPVVNVALLTWPTTAAQMPAFTYKCAAAKEAYSRWVSWSVINTSATISESTAQYSVFLLEELTPYM